MERDGKIRIAKSKGPMLATHMRHRWSINGPDIIPSDIPFEGISNTKTYNFFRLYL